MDKRSTYRHRKKLKGEVSVQLFLKEEYVTAIDMKVERRQKNGEKANRSEVTNEWIWQAMESLDLAHVMSVGT